MVQSSSAISVHVTPAKDEQFHQSRESKEDDEALWYNVYMVLLELYNMLCLRSVDY